MTKRHSNFEMAIDGIDWDTLVNGKNLRLHQTWLTSQFRPQYSVSQSGLSGDTPQEPRERV
jgi:hypothetical protein